MLINWKIDSNWFSYESNGRNPDRFKQRRLFFSRYLKMRLKIILSKNFATYWQQRNRPIVLQKMIITFRRNNWNIWLFPVIRKRPSLQTVVEKYWGLTIEESHIFNSLIDISSYFFFYKTITRLTNLQQAITK